MEKLPIICVRGHAGPTAGIDAAVDDPFHGFNAGCTHVRVGGDGEALDHQFEGPLLRLMLDEGYQLLVQGDQRRCLAAAEAAGLPRASLWVHRFYDRAATTFGIPRARDELGEVATAVRRHLDAPGFAMEEAARGLYDLVQVVREKTGAPRVHLVAHSTGGLVVRTMMQNTCLQPGNESARDLVARFFTFGTPHGGIRFRSPALDWAERALGLAGSDVFAPSRMHDYLTPHGRGSDVPEDWDPQVLPREVFDTGDVFCLVGTDPEDCSEAAGLSRAAVGPRSDGLVRIEHAHIRGAHRAYVHRSHSGRYGEVNSEEGYQNLRRFLFGRWQVRVDLVGLPRDLPRDRDGGTPVWQADVRLSIRGLPVVLSEQTAAHWCPVELDEELRRDSSGQGDTVDHPVPLLSTFLLDPAAGWAHDRARCTVTLRVSELVQHHHGFGSSFGFGDHLEQVPDWEDALIVDVGPGAAGGVPQVEAAWNSQVQGRHARYDRITDGLPPDERRPPAATCLDGAAVHEVPLPPAALELPVLGLGARLRIIVLERAGDQDPHPAGDLDVATGAIPATSATSALDAR